MPLPNAAARAPAVPPETCCCCCVTVTVQCLVLASWAVTVYVTGELKFSAIPDCGLIVAYALTEIAGVSEARLEV